MLKSVYTNTYNGVILMNSNSSEFSQYNVLSSNIMSRHSTRRFLPDPIPDHVIDGILEAGLLAPSSKNRQPWRITVLHEESIKGLVAAMSTAISKEIANLDDDELINDHRMALRTMEAIKSAPVLLVIGYKDFRPYRNAKMMNTGMTDRSLVDTLSIGACIENILLESAERGICSLWVGDYLYAYDAAMAYLRPDYDIVSMVALGHPAEEGWNRIPRCTDRIDYR